MYLPSLLPIHFTSSNVLRDLRVGVLTLLTVSDTRWTDGKTGKEQCSVGGMTSPSSMLGWGTLRAHDRGAALAMVQQHLAATSRYLLVKATVILAVAYG